jgi:23S rRNA pseudouridine2605 synthase
VLTVSEGRQHLVKRLCAAVGYPVVRLFRPAHAGIGVQGLRPGHVRRLTRDEIDRVKGIAGGAPAPPVELRLPARRHGPSGSTAAEEPDEDTSLRQASRMAERQSRVALRQAQGERPAQGERREAQGGRPAQGERRDAQGGRQGQRSGGKPKRAGRRR